ncbi:hypothetical protein T10_4822, partial [Trichinella papuae]
LTHAGKHAYTSKHSSTLANLCITMMKRRKQQQQICRNLLSLYNTHLYGLSNNLMIWKLNAKMHLSLKMTDKKKANFRPDVSTTTTTTNRTIIIIPGDVVSIVSMIQQFNNKPTNLLACQKITNTNKASSLFANVTHGQFQFYKRPLVPEASSALKEGRESERKEEDKTKAEEEKRIRGI